MKCFRHHAAEAVGVCKACSKGLCRACANELKNGIACAGLCEEIVTSLRHPVDNSKDYALPNSIAYAAAGSLSIVTAFCIFKTSFVLASSLFGLSFILWGLSVFYFKGFRNSNADSISGSLNSKFKIGEISKSELELEQAFEKMESDARDQFPKQQ